MHVFYTQHTIVNSLYICTNLRILHDLALTCSALAWELYYPCTLSSLAGQTSPEKKDGRGHRSPAIRCTASEQHPVVCCGNHLPEGELQVYDTIILG